MRPLARMLAVAALLAAALAIASSASSAPHCAAGENPEFATELAPLRTQLGAVMGSPTECAHVNAANGDLLQQTTTGLAYVRASTRAPIFTDGAQHWALTSRGLLTWAGGSVDAPPGAAPVATPTATATTRPAGTPNASPTASLAAVPNCPKEITPIFTALPMALDHFLAFRPLGFLSPPTHVFPAKHSNFALARPGEPYPKHPVSFPGDLWVTEVNVVEYEGLNKTGYGVTFYPCREFKLYFGHLSSVSEPLRAAMQSATVACNPPYETGGTTVKGCRYLMAFKVKAGDLAGTSGDAAGVDFGAIDYRTPPLAFVRPEHYMSEMRHYVSPVPYFVPEARVRLESKLTSYDGTTPRTAEPRVGAIMQDVPGTAQGNWFPPGQNLSIPFLQPDAFMALVHDYVDPAQPVISMGNAVKGLKVGLYSFAPRPAGLVNRDFSQVTPDGRIYCYEDFSSGRTAGGLGVGNPRGVILLRLLDAETLQIELQTARLTCGDPSTWALTANASSFER